MSKYDMLLKSVAQEFHTTPLEVEREIKEAIAAAGYDMSPQIFIALCAAKVKSEIRSEQ